MIYEFRERRNFDKLNAQAPLKVSALEWNAHRPYSSLTILVNWAGPAANSCYLDGLERGKPATGILVFRSPGGLVSVEDGDFITKLDGNLHVHRKATWLKSWEKIPETTEDRVAL